MSSVAPVLEKGVAPAPAETHHVLRDGSTVCVRAVRADDETRLADFLVALSPDSRSLRFSATLSDERVRREATRLARPDADEAVGLVATVGRQERIIGHAEYALMGRERAEVALVVADACQGHASAPAGCGQQGAARRRALRRRQR